MKTIKNLISAITALFFITSAEAHEVKMENVDIRVAGNYLVVNADLNLDSLKLKGNQQVLVTPVVRRIGSSSSSSMSDLSDFSDNGQRATGNEELTLPSVLISGRNMHFSYERGVLRNFPAIKDHYIIKEVQRHNGTGQSVAYSTRVLVEPWMLEQGSHVDFTFDECGCGVEYAQVVHQEPISYMEEIPVNEMQAMVIIPEIEDIPVEIHAGRARVQFEVDKTQLHVEPYICMNGQRIDNREQLKIIDDSVKYALSDPNVELTAIEICGYASPESPYLHNVELASGRSKALAEYLAKKYNLPQDRVTYTFVPENWEEFRDTVISSNAISELQRTQLLDLIDEPAYTPEEYDRKEWLLKTDPKFSDLYRSKILPQWFPKLRATTFALHTQLKPMDDEKLMEVIKTTPEKMSLNQMYRVARMYPADSDEFNDIMLKAMELHPGEQTAVTNAAIAAIARGEYGRARELLGTVEQTQAVEKLLNLIKDR